MPRPRPPPPGPRGPEPFEFSDDDVDRSVEGPVHPHELREPVASGAWSREWLSWQPRQAKTPLLATGRRGRTTGSSWRGRHTAPPPPAKLGPARRPLLALVGALVMVVAVVVVSSVAVISPYETNGIVQLLDQAADATLPARPTGSVRVLCRNTGVSWPGASTARHRGRRATGRLAAPAAGGDPRLQRDLRPGRMAPGLGGPLPRTSAAMRTSLSAPTREGPHGAPALAQTSPIGGQCRAQTSHRPSGAGRRGQLQFGPDSLSAGARSPGLNPLSCSPPSRKRRGQPEPRDF